MHIKSYLASMAGTSRYLSETTRGVFLNFCGKGAGGREGRIHIVVCLPTFKLKLVVKGFSDNNCHNYCEITW